MKSRERIPGDAYPALQQFYYRSDIALPENKGVLEVG
jgi:hypothetical protein